MDPQALLATITRKSLPPVHQWHPELCGEIDIRIARDGTWYHEGSPIRRQRMVELFSTVLRKDPDGCYYLVTPVEKLKIEVEDAPFIAIAMEAAGEGEEQVLVFTTNVGDQVVAGEQHPLRLAVDPVTGEPSPYVMVRDGLEARINRPTFYHLVDRAVEQEGRLRVWSNGTLFELGDVS
ncbi:MAG: DUF1285 domain-containing protein [Gammaproteobacteria bacterium]